MAAWRWRWQEFASPPNIWRILRQIPDMPSSRSPSVQAKMRAAAKPSLSSGPAFPPHTWRLLKFSDASSRSSLVGWCQWSASWISRFVSLGGPARSNQPESGLDIQSGRTTYRRHRPAAKPHQPAMKRHLYVVLEDYHEDGFAIHKLDIDDDLDVLSGSGQTLLRLLDAPVVRIPRPVIGKEMQFAALGSSIIATGICRLKNSTSCMGVTVVYDTKTAVLTVSNLLPTKLISYGYDFAVAVRNRLYVFESYTVTRDCRCQEVKCKCNQGGLYCLKTTDPSDDDKLQADCNEDNKLWKWQPLPNSSRFFWSSNNLAPMLPFDASRVTAHAVHPRGRTIFVSAGGWQVGLGTFSYGIQSGKWTRRGDWILPFKGPAHYDPELDAWVGLYFPDDTGVNHKTGGYLCASRVTAAQASSQPPQWKVCTEKLFWEDLDCSQVNVQLLYMGECSKYCLVEHLRLEGAVSKHVLRLTTFQVTYGKDGELMIMAHRPARSYQVPSYEEDFDAQAFWM